MKKYFLLFCFFFANITLAQAIKGRVFDETNKPLFGATIFLDGTSISTISNEEGFFQLPVIARINTNLVVSYVGYQSVSIASYNDTTELKITLQPSINSLKEVVIKKERFTRKEMLKLFREQFLGETKAGKKAIILNENDLDFEYDENYKVFKASSDKPLIIQNPVFGYEVTYEISDFIVQFHSLSIKSEDVHKILFTGVSRFKETSNSKEVVKERMKSYRGSVLHFFRSLVSDKMVENDFMLVKSKKIAAVKDNFKLKDNLGLIEVKLNDMPMKVVSKNALVDEKFYAHYQISFQKSRTSAVTFLTQVFNVDQFGIHSNVADILFAGDMSDKRVGDLLPTNYGIEGTKVLDE
ncbi:carboxypeptidase-like regulatory domain-containing protein [Flavobacterium solisilvae]|uniref:Carboxypeptidase-like regulatory domain-containing protein n=1 Tax=Flavobacterium solisilvae TaxID=1852019 RepID=A0ABX1QVH6_9FLAO|nr:carboxypeptidase-like regulatory domain-containing protein [Flavobacterium solisilvae]NMH26251.1 hypothetical protein [Flavobacterium solisilvae]